MLQGLGPIPAGWLQVGGLLLCLLGLYYLAIALRDKFAAPALAFYQATVVGRSIAAVGLAMLVATKSVPWVVLILAATNAYGAYSMAKALRKDSRRWVA